MQASLFRKRLLVSVLIASCLGFQAHGQSTDDMSSRRLLDSIDTILAKHIDPPTRQQMLLCGAKAVYGGLSDRPDDLSHCISQLVTDEQFLAFLDSLEKVHPNSASQFMQGVLENLPGGGMLFAAEEARVQEQLDANRYVGIGIALTTHDGQPQILKVFYNGPGHKAGVEQGDLILKIDGAATEGKELAQVVSQLRGAAGTNVSLALQQPGAGPREIEVIRDVTFIPTIEGASQKSAGQWQFELEAHPGIILLNIKQVGPSTVHELSEIVAGLRDTNLKGIILDLRESSGTLHDIVMLADQLLDEGTLGHVQGRTSRTTHVARPGCLFRDIPMVVLVTPVSGAAPKFLAAALRDLGRAEVVGQFSAEPDYALSRIELPRGEYLQLATAILQRGDGSPLSSGMQPTPASAAGYPLSALDDPNTSQVENHLRVPPSISGSAVLTDPSIARAVEVLTVPGVPKKSDDE